MGTWSEKPNGGWELVTSTRNPHTILNDMARVTDPDKALDLCREFYGALVDHEMVLYQP